jgi:regulator of sirC expression with transglutaminase-like and TPR domain
MLMRHRLFIVIILIIFAFLSCTSVVRSRNNHTQKDLCQDYGNAPFPLWSHYTNLEIEILKKADSARAGNPDALLAFAIFASGNVRDSATYNNYVNRIKTFVDTARKSLDSIKNSKELCSALYLKICQEFYGTSFFTNELSGYVFEQSRVSELLRTQKYNCISSAMLCLVIFRYFDLDIQGVMLPSHVFLQLNTPDSGSVEIETTLKSGFDYKHDAEYFKKIGQWTKSRNLLPITKADYEHRLLVSAFELVCSNMNNQHTMTDKMDTCDRNRLYETLGYLFPKHPLWLSNQLSVYNDFFIRYQTIKDYATALLMYKKIDSNLEMLPAQWKTDTLMLAKIYLIAMSHAITLEKNGDHNKAMQKANMIMGSINTRFNKYDLLLNNVMWIYAAYIQSLAMLNKYNEAEILLQSCPTVLMNLKQMRATLFNLYGAKASHYFQNNKFHEAVLAGFQAVMYSDSSTRIITYSNIQAAYLNQSRQLVIDNQKEDAQKVLQECINKVPDCTQCVERMNKLLGK